MYSTLARVASSSALTNTVTTCCTVPYHFLWWWWQEERKKKEHHHHHLPASLRATTPIHNHWYPGRSTTTTGRYNPQTPNTQIPFHVHKKYATTVDSALLLLSVMQKYYIFFNHQINN